jgi:hypothetical protein
VTHIEREALALDEAIDALLSGRAAPALPLIDQAGRVLRSVESLPPSTGIDAARRRMFEADARPPRRWILRLVAGVTAATVTCVGGVAFAARDARPGDALFGIHRAEQASRIALSANETARAEATLGRAAGDVADAEAFARAGLLQRATQALDIFWQDMDAARSAIASAPPDAQARLTARAADLVSKADALGARLVPVPTTSSVVPETGRDHSVGGDRGGRGSSDDGTRSSTPGGIGGSGRDGSSVSDSGAGSSADGPHDQSLGSAGSADLGSGISGTQTSGGAIDGQSGGTSDNSSSTSGDGSGSTGGDGSASTGGEGH